MLYDTSADVIRKALRGLGMAPSEAATRAGLPEREVIAASREPAAAELLRQLAPALGLSPDGLAGLSTYQPPQALPPEITRLELEFGDETVNAWWVDCGGGDHALFDTGNGPQDVRRHLDHLLPPISADRGISVFITHDHGDHTGGLPGLKGLIGQLHGKEVRGGQSFSCGGLRIRTIDLPGHCEGAVGYLVEGLALPVCVTGDALFAGSIGGCAPGEPYQSALAALRAGVMTLPDETVILTGHGPATTVGAERRGNAFLGA